MQHAGLVRPPSTPEAVARHLLERIRAGEFGPDGRLPSEKELQTALGVGRFSLREALARLSALGIIRVAHGRGAFVQAQPDSEAIGAALTPLFPAQDPKRLNDLIAARGILEGEMAALAAQHRKRRDIERLHELLDRLPRETPEDEVLVELDHAFHREIARIAGNEFLSVMAEAIGEQTRAFLRQYVRAFREPRNVIDRHRPILEAIEAGDAEGARRAARAHVDLCKSSVSAATWPPTRERNA